MTVGPPFAAHAVVFDMDGILIDSEDLWGQAEERLVRSYGRPWKPAVRERLMGHGPDEVGRVLAEHLGLRGREEELVDRLQEYVLAAFEQLEANPGVVPLVIALAQRVPLAVATNSRRRLAEFALARAGLGECFSALVSADDTSAPKPAAQPYAMACQLLGVAPSSAVAIEDSAVGVASAKAAGLWVLGCPSRPGDRLHEADAVVAQLADVDAERLLGSQPALRRRGTSVTGSGTTPPSPW